MYPRIFHGGRWMDELAASVPVGSLAMRYGLSVFEGIRLYRQADGSGVRPFRLAEHLRRLGHSLALTRIPDPGIARLPALVTELAERNGIKEDAYVRIAVSAGNPGLMDAEVEPVLTVTATPMGRKRWLRAGAGMRLQVSAWQRAAEAAFPAAAKNISGYAGPRLALLAAKDSGYDGCVLTNSNGRLCEAPTAALFILRDGVLRTPALTEGVLPSITRAWTLVAAAELGFTAVESMVDRTDAYLADEAFLCGTGLEFAPVQSFDGHQCASWPDNPVTRSLINHFFHEVRGAALRGAA